MALHHDNDRRLQSSGNSLSSDEGAPRRRHGSTHPAAQRSRSVSPVAELAADQPAPDEDVSDGEERQLLSRGCRSPDHSCARQHRLGSRPSDGAAFDGIEAVDGESGSGRGRRSPGSVHLRRHLPGLADFWDGITPELVAVAMGEGADSLRLDTLISCGCITAIWPVTMQ